MRLLALLATLVFTHAAWAAGPVEVDRIVAVVNSDVVTRSDLRLKVEQISRQLTRQGTPLPADDVLERQVLERLIMEKLQIQLANETSLRVDDLALDRALGRIADNNKLSMTEFRQALEKDGITWDRFREEIRTEMLLSRLREREVESRIVVSDAEVSNFLAHPENTQSQEEFNLAHILLRAPEGATPEQLARLRARAEDVAARVARGEPFDKLAASYSDAPDALSGGNLGWRSAERLPGLFADAVTRMKPGETSPILRSAAGFHIVRLIDRRGGGDALGATQVQQTHARH
ncbi:MAG TPA: peptidylprolyl isomerase, partial [Rhodocyclaceae bacterium]|nr:peptidylprolyl isomerase [Rhodocyclaceae bacterium]